PQPGTDEAPIRDTGSVTGIRDTRGAGTVLMFEVVCTGCVDSPTQTGWPPVCAVTCKARGTANGRQLLASVAITAVHSEIKLVLVAAALEPAARTFCSTVAYPFPLVPK